MCYIFPNVTGIYFKNSFAIHPAFQKFIPILIEWAKQNSNIKELKIFGSAITPYIHQGSDLDVWCNLYKNEKLVRPNISCSLDIITNFDDNTILQQNINKDGISIYEADTT